MNLTPVFAAIMGIAFLGESLYACHAFGLALVIGDIWMAQCKPESNKVSTR